METKEIKTKEEARQFAIDWQNWQVNESLDYMSLAHWHNYFATLGNRFNLTEEFIENGII